MPTTLHLLLTIAVAALLVPTAVFALECLLSVWPLRREPDGDTAAPLRTVVLVPAHNEELVLAQTLERLLPSLAPGDRALVVADNCTDRTAEIARQCGAEVLERTDPTRRAKGFALDFGVRALAADPPDVLVILDADSQVEPRTIATLSRRTAASGRPVQALYLLEAGDGRPVQLVSEFGFRFKNLVRPLGLARLGLPCQLMGSGMALPWTIADRVVWASDHLTEDMQLGLDLALTGTPAVFCPEARVTSRFPDRPAAWLSQRTRWEQGHLRTLVQHVPRLTWAALRQRRIDLAALALDLLVPPLSLLILLWLAAAGAAGAGWLCGASAGALWLLAAGGLLAGVAVAAAWAVHCRERIPLRTVAAIPGYIVRKLPIYASFFLRKGERRWVRTERETAGVPE
ncbi:MAG TPA: glycosyltransferase family 2 protein [Planctomycetaceae bacterium]|nr:glycosyltransferase family 2 protein [Planctomycetaceae bacterium]